MSNLSEIELAWRFKTERANITAIATRMRDAGVAIPDERAGRGLRHAHEIAQMLLMGRPHKAIAQHVGCSRPNSKSHRNRAAKRGHLIHGTCGESLTRASSLEAGHANVTSHRLGARTENRTRL